MMRIKRLRISLALLLSLALFGVYTPIVFGESTAQIQEVRDLLEKYHLSKPTEEDLGGDEINSMVDSLQDPYTEYFDEEQWNTFNSALEQTFVGIGIVMGEGKGTVYIEELLPNSPAQAVGLLAGDVLISADDKSLEGKSLTEIQGAIRGVEGSWVTLGVSRNGKALKFSIERKSIHLPIVTTQMLGDGVGYLALSGFASDSGNQVKDNLIRLENEGMTSLVLDLRNNGGGYVTAAQEIAGLFIKEGVLAHMRDRDGNDNPIVLKGSTKPYEVVVIQNSNSASASELLAGALQDYGVAKLVGTNSYGKGVVQSLIELNSGGVLKLTIQEYYTPTGRKVDKVGLKPDILLEGVAQQLIGAYQLAGGEEITLTSDNGTFNINGLRMSQQGVILKETNGWHINVRLAALLLGAELKYDAISKTITLIRGNEVHSIKTNDYLIEMIDGSSNIHMGLLKKWYSDVSYTVTGNMAKLTVK